MAPCVLELDGFAGFAPSWTRPPPASLLDLCCAAGEIPVCEGDSNDWPSGREGVPCEAAHHARAFHAPARNDFQPRRVLVSPTPLLFINLSIYQICLNYH